MWVDVEIALNPDGVLGGRVALDQDDGSTKEGTIVESSGSGFTIQFDDGTRLEVDWANLAEKASSQITPL
jgi:hypothetical protein